MSLQHSTETCTCNIFMCVPSCDFVPATCSRYRSPQCALHKFFVAPICRRNMSPQHDPSCLPTFILPRFDNIVRVTNDLFSKNSDGCELKPEPHQSSGFLNN